MKIMVILLYSLLLTTTLTQTITSHHVKQTAKKTALICSLLLGGGTYYFTNNPLVSFGASLAGLAMGGILKLLLNTCTPEYQLESIEALSETIRYSFYHSLTAEASNFDTNHLAHEIESRYITEPFSYVTALNDAFSYRINLIKLINKIEELLKDTDASEDIKRKAKQLLFSTHLSRINRIILFIKSHPAYVYQSSEKERQRIAQEQTRLLKEQIKAQTLQAEATLATAASTILHNTQQHESRTTTCTNTNRQGESTVTQRTSLSQQQSHVRERVSSRQLNEVLHTMIEHNNLRFITSPQCRDEAAKKI